jgi:DNA-binding transcriptional LysR family regulator
VGIAHLPSERVTALLADGRLVRLLDDWLPQMPGFFLYYPSRRQMPGPLRAFIEFAKAELGDDALARRRRNPRKR